MIQTATASPLWGSRIQPEPRSWRETSGEHWNRSKISTPNDSNSYCKASLGLGSPSEIMFGPPWARKSFGNPIWASLGLGDPKKIKFALPSKSEVLRKTRSGLPGARRFSEIKFDLPWGSEIPRESRSELPGARESLETPTRPHWASLIEILVPLAFDLAPLRAEIPAGSSGHYPRHL